MKLVYEVLDEVKKSRKKEDKVRILKENESWALKDIIKGSMDESVQWNLPGGSPPYTPSEGHNAPTSLFREHKKFKYFVKGVPTSDGMNPIKRESLFIGLIEGIHPEDAKLVIAMINKTKPAGLTKPLVDEAFPGLVK
jgi:hypothetical protein